MALILAVIGLLGLAQIGQAANLPAGWYANIRSVDVYTYDSEGISHLTTGGYFYDNPTGDYAPFHVGGPLVRLYDERDVSVPTSVCGATPEQSLYLPLYIPLYRGTWIAGISATTETNYDPARMNLQLWHTTSAGMTTRLWTQSVGGQQYGGVTFAEDEFLDGTYFFKVAIVPEPPSLLALTLGFLVTAIRFRRLRS